MSADRMPVFVPGTKSRFKKESRRLGFLFYEAMYGPLVFVRAVYRQLVILVGMFAWGTIIFHTYNSLGYLKALLASVSTITTIGLYVPFGGDFTQMTEVEALLLIVMIIVSVGVGASILQGTVNTIVNGALAKGEAERRMMTRLRNHVIVFGYSHLGKYVVEKLNSLGFDYVVITKDPLVYQQLLRQEVLVVHESETQPIDALKQAGIEKASMVVVAHESDPDNMLLILSARKLRPDIRIVSVVHNDSLIETAKNAGADIVIPSSVTVGHLLALSAVTKDLVGIVFSEKIGTREIAQFSVFSSSKLVGQKMDEVSKLAVIIGVVRDDQVVQRLFDSSFRLKEGDTLLVLGNPAELETLERQANAK